MATISSERLFGKELKTLQNEKKQLQQKLNNEMEIYTFASSDKVINRTHPKTWQQKLTQWWNKEITVSIVPVGVATFFLLTAALAPTFMQQENHYQLRERQIIEVGGYFYWSDLLEGVKKK